MMAKHRLDDAGRYVVVVSPEWWRLRMHLVRATDIADLRYRITGERQDPKHLCAS